MRLFQWLFRWRKVTTQERGQEEKSKESLTASSSAQFVREEVRLSPMWLGELGGSKHETVQLQGPPEEFFAKKELPLLWPDDPDYVSMMNEKDREDRKQYLRYLRFAWYIAYLHHNDPDVIIRTLKTVSDAGLVYLYLPELLIHDNPTVRQTAAALAWEKCDDASLQYILTTLSDTGAFPSGIPHQAARQAVELLRYTCPSNRQSLLQQSTPWLLGELVITPGAKEALEGSKEGPEVLEAFLLRHQKGDWGNMSESDKLRNDMARKRGRGRMMSEYELKDGTRIWVITESDWSRTTILLPHEY